MRLARPMRRLQGCSNGLRMARMPARSATRSRGRATAGKMWVCLWVSTWVTVMPARWSLLDLGEGFAGDVGFADVAAQDGEEEVGEGGAEGFAVGAEEGGDALRVARRGCRR